MNENQAYTECQTCQRNAEMAKRKAQVDEWDGARLARMLGVSVDELLGIKDIKVPTKAPSRRVIRRLERIEELPKRDQDALLRTIDAFLANSA